MTDIAISIIVPSYNAADRIRRCLQALVNQTTALKYEIIVIDSSVDDTASIVRNEFPGVRLQTSKERLFPGAARNHGIKIARGRVLAFADTKMTVPPGWLDRISEALGDETLAAITGSWTLDKDWTIPGWIQFHLEFFDFLPKALARQVKSAPAGNSAIKRLLLGEIRFADDLRAAEDVVLFSKLAKTEQIRFIPELQAAYTPEGAWRACWNHIRTLGYWSGVARRKHILRGSFLAKYWVLAPLLAPYRFSRFLFHGVVQKKLNYFQLMAISPAAALFLTAWTISFIKGARSQGN